MNHSVCERCYKKNNSNPRLCPVARCSYPQVKREDNFQLELAIKCCFQELKRNWTAERLVELSGYRLKCSNADLGCQTKLAVLELRRHEEGCRFKEIQCPNDDCTER